MTTERSGMSLEQAIAYLHAHVNSSHNADWKKKREAWNIIMSHLSRDAVVSGDPAPSYWTAIGDIESDGSGGEIVLAYPAADGNGGEAARSECNDYINNAMLVDGVKLHLTPLYTREALSSFAARHAAVPDAMPEDYFDTQEEVCYRNGWNAYRKAMLAQRDGGEK